MTELGWSAVRTCLEAGLNNAAVAVYLSRGRYPRYAETYQRLAQALGQPPATAERWIAEANANAKQLGARPALNRPAPQAGIAEYEQTICLTCEKPFPVLPGEQPKYCGRLCKSKADRKFNLAKNELKQAFARELASRRKTLADVARETGVNRRTVGKWLADPDRYFTVTILGRLAPWMGRSLDELVRMQGGTGDEKRAETGHRTGPVTILSTHTPESSAKSARSRKGKPRPEDWIQKRREMWAELSPEEQARRTENARAWTRSAEGRLSRSLTNHLKGFPVPTHEQVTTWAEASALRMNLPMSAVLSIWRPRLRRRGLMGAPGRPPIERRHNVILKLMHRHGIQPSDRMPRGFWSEAFREVSNAEGQQAPATPQSVRQWWIDHKTRCLSCPNTTEIVLKKA
jgi:transcriptional regulator with XRE-family HTH domain